MEPLEIYDAINNKVIHVYVSKEVAEKCRTDTEFAQDLFNKLQDQDIEEGCSLEIETIKAEGNDETENNELVDEEESPTEEKTDKEFWSRNETLKLIKAYQKYKDTFNEHRQRKVVWAMIAAELSQSNIFKSAVKCAEKWKNMVRTYKVVNEKPNFPSRFQYYQQLHDILSTTEILVSDTEADESTEIKYTPLSASEVAELKDSILEENTEKESWSRYETLKFLKTFQMFKHMKNNFSKEKHFWSIISAQLAKDNIHKHHEKCSAKWKNLLRSYRKNLEKPNMPTRFQYFQEVNDVVNDTELEIPDHVRFTGDVEKIADPEHYKSILEETELENCKDPVSWNAEETLKLIQAYKKHKDQFKKCHSRKLVWAMISSELMMQGLNRNAEKVENKWKSLLRSYRRGESKGESPRFYFFEEMQEALGNETENSNYLNNKDSLEESTSMDNTDVVFDNSDHDYSENPSYEQIIIEAEQDDGTGNENYWSFSGTAALLRAYANCKRKFRETKKTRLWEEVSNELESVDIQKSALCCEIKWQKLFSMYKTHKLNKTGPDNFQFFQEIDDILRNSDNSDTEDTIGHCRKCKCSEKKLLDKQNRHLERMQMLKRKLDIEERKVEAFESYVKYLRSSNNDGS